MVFETKTNPDQGQQENGAATAQREVVTVMPNEPNSAMDHQTTKKPGHTPRDDPVLQTVMRLPEGAM